MNSYGKQTNVADIAMEQVTLLIDIRQLSRLRVKGAMNQRISKLVYFCIP